ncbi:MAG: peptidylprolyl isomerase [Desulfobulbus propionicus]|nr:MAG: peptidylprolyl isomerase [Desulfobulbus propionicus]
MRTIIALFLLFSLQFLSPSSLLAEVIDRSIAIVNDDIITLSEVNDLGGSLFEKIKQEAPPTERDDTLQQARQKILEQLIDKKILLQEARKKELSVSDDEVTRAMERIIASNSVSKKDFIAELERMGLTLEQYRQDLHDQILSSRLVTHEVRSKVVIPEDSITEYYRTNFTQQAEKGGYYILQIGCSWDVATSREKAKEKAERVHSLAAQGMNFKELARTHSDLPSAADGGDLGVFQENEMADYMRAAVTSLQPGEISEIVETPAGFQFFKLLSSQEGEMITKVPYESVREEIRQTLYEQELQALYQEWVKEMRAKSYIKIL